jgi:septum formation protein
MGISFSVVSADVEEVSGAIFPPRVPFINAMKKAVTVAEQYPEALVLGADTIIEFNEHIIGKPDSPEHAYRILKMFSGHTHYAVTAVCLMCLSCKIKSIFCEETAVTFHELEDSVIRSYLDKVEVYDKAGAYAIQEHGDMLIKRIDGSLDNVIGLPGQRVLDAIHACGLDSFMLKQAPSL